MCMTGDECILATLQGSALQWLSSQLIRELDVGKKVVDFVIWLYLDLLVESLSIVKQQGPLNADIPTLQEIYSLNYN